MDFFPAMDHRSDGWLSWTWAVRVARELPDELEGLAHDIQACVFNSLVDAFAAIGDLRRDPIRVKCRRTAPDRLDVTIEVQSQHPDWRMGATFGALQGIDRRLHITHLQDLPRSQIQPWYLAEEVQASG